MKDWYLNWDMDGMQWEVLRVDLYEFKQDTCGYEGAYYECMLYINNHLLNNRNYYRKPDIYLHCSEGTFMLNEQDIRIVLAYHCPEELI